MSVVEIINNGLEILASVKLNQKCWFKIKTNNEKEPKPFLFITCEHVTPIKVWRIENTDGLLVGDKELLKYIASALIDKYEPNHEFSYEIIPSICDIEVNSDIEKNINNEYADLIKRMSIFEGTYGAEFYKGDRHEYARKLTEEFMKTDKVEISDAIIYDFFLTRIF